MNKFVVVVGLLFLIANPTLAGVANATTIAQGSRDNNNNLTTTAATTTTTTTTTTATTLQQRLKTIKESPAGQKILELLLEASTRSGFTIETLVALGIPRLLFFAFLFVYLYRYVIQKLPAPMKGMELLVSPVVGLAATDMQLPLQRETYISIIQILFLLVAFWTSIVAETERYKDTQDSGMTKTRRILAIVLAIFVNLILMLGPSLNPVHTYFEILAELIMIVIMVINLIQVMGTDPKDMNPQIREKFTFMSEEKFPQPPKHWSQPRLILSIVLVVSFVLMMLFTIVLQIDHELELGLLGEMTEKLPMFQSITFLLYFFIPFYWILMFFFRSEQITSKPDMLVSLAHLATLRDCVVGASFALTELDGTLCREYTHVPWIGIRGSAIATFDDKENALTFVRGIHAVDTVVKTANKVENFDTIVFPEIVRVAPAAVEDEQFIIADLAHGEYHVIVDSGYNTKFGDGTLRGNEKSKAGCELAKIQSGSSSWEIDCLYNGPGTFFNPAKVLILPKQQAKIGDDNDLVAKALAGQLNIESTAIECAEPHVADLGMTFCNVKDQPYSVVYAPRAAEALLVVFAGRAHKLQASLQHRTAGHDIETLMLKRISPGKPGEPFSGFIFDAKCKGCDSPQRATLLSHVAPIYGHGENAESVADINEADSDNLVQVKAAVDSVHGIVPAEVMVFLAVDDSSSLVLPSLIGKVR